jgi:hypothetical protein
MIGEIMAKIAGNSYCFGLEQGQYKRIRALGRLFLCALLVCMVLGIIVGIGLWRTYSHQFTPYLKWQDALVSLSWFVSFISVWGSLLVMRFLHALYEGYSKGMVTYEYDCGDGSKGNSLVMVRDLSAENMKSILWMMNSSFWCFVAVLIGLVPAIVVGWTLHMTQPLLAVVLTALAGLLFLAGLAISAVGLAFIVVGLIGSISFGRKLGSSHRYHLNVQATIRIDNFVLAFIYPGEVESMVDLNLLSSDDRRLLLSLLHKRWLDTEQAWNPELGDEIERALHIAGD